MSDPQMQLSQTLKRHGYSLTTQRRAVFNALQACEAQSMHELIIVCSSVDRASLYRIIELFEKLHIVQRLQIGWKYKLELTGTFIAHHHHLACEQCGLVVALPEDEIIEKQLQIIADRHKFDAHDHQLEIRGLCKDCQAAISSVA